jgi:hypothetical protein
MANAGAKRLVRSGQHEAERHFPSGAAQTRIVSLARIRLNPRKSVRHFKGIICGDISEFESSSKIVAGNPWPSLLSSLRPVLCAPKSGLPSRSFCVFVHCQCAIRDLEFAMSFATNPDTIEQAHIDGLGL